MRPESRPTDWDSYYSRPYRTSSLTRRYTGSVLVAILRRLDRKRLRILELGGANSCFIDRILQEIRPARYDVLDNNQLGLDLLRARFPRDPRIELMNRSVLDLHWDRPRYDVVFSVGLIEHFERPDTARAIAAHFSPLRPGGATVITFPTPTLLYRAVRWLSEATGNWIFLDERPLRLDEFRETAEEHGRIVSARILWPQILTQYCVVTEKR